jgi:O-antigen/teichoic acid export membrane protein
LVESPHHEKENLRIFAQGSRVILLGLSARILLVFATEVIAARLLLPERYGLITWGLFLLNLLCSITGLGLDIATRRFLPIFHAKNDAGSVNGTIIVSTVLSGSSGVLGGFLLFMGASWLAADVMGDLREIPILLILALAVPLCNLQRVMLSVFAGFKCPAEKVLIEDVLVPAGFLLVVIMAWAMGWNEVPIARGYVLVYLVSTLVAVLLVRTRTPRTAISSARPRYPTAEMLRFSWPLMITHPIGKSTGLIDTLLIGMFVAPHELGMYRIASDMAAVMTIVLMVFGFMYLPLAAELVTRGEHEQCNELNSRVARWSLLVTFPLFATLFFFPREVIHTVYGANYFGAAPVLQTLALAYFGNAMVGMSGLSLVAAGMTKTHLLIDALGFTIVVVGNLFMIPKYGIQGAAVVTLVSLWVKTGVFLTIMRVRLGIQPFNFLYLRTFLLLMLVPFGSVYLLHIGSLPDFALLLAFVSICLACMGLLCRWGYIIDATDTELVRTIVFSPMRRPG